MPSITEIGGATDKQVAYIEGLMNERQFNSEEQERKARARYAELMTNGELDVAAASTIITFLLSLPKLPQTLPKNGEPRDIVSELRGAPDVPAGRYAVEMDGVLKFYKVDKPTEGRWAGRTFVKVQASDEFHPIRNVTERGKILHKIQEDTPRAASLRYGLELGHCGVCGITLTNEESRSRGIGPICAGKMNW